MDARTGSTNDSDAWIPMIAFPTSLPPTPSSIAMPDEFSDATDVTGGRRNSISTRPTTQSVSTKQVNTKTGSTWNQNPHDKCLEAPQAQPSELSEAPTNQPAERKSELQKCEIFLLNKSCKGGGR